MGVETQRQWSDRAIARTTPALLGLFSWTTLAAHALQKRHPMTQRRAAFTTSRRPPSWTPSPWCGATCGWRPKVFHYSAANPDTQELPVALYHRLVDSLAYAA